MPNWCQNEVNIYGTEEEITRFTEFVKSKELRHGLCSDKYSTKFNKETEKWESITKTKGYVCEYDDDFKETCYKVQDPFSFNSILPMPIILEGSSSPPHVFDTQEEVDAYNEEHKDTHFIGKAVTKSQLQELRDVTGHDNWYDWCVENWGTKWDVGGEVIDFEDTGDSVRLEFDTAWCPPNGIYEKLVEEFPDISISWFYREEGQQFAGYLPD